MDHIDDRRLCCGTPPGKAIFYLKYWKTLVKKEEEEISWTELDFNTIYRTHQLLSCWRYWVFPCQTLVGVEPLSHQYLHPEGIHHAPEWIDEILDWCDYLLPFLVRFGEVIMYSIVFLKVDIEVIGFSQKNQYFHDGKSYSAYWCFWFTIWNSQYDSDNYHTPTITIQMKVQ